MVIQSLECVKCVGWMMGFVSHILGEGQGPNTGGLVITATSLALPSLFVLLSGLTKIRVPDTGLG